MICPTVGCSSLQLVVAGEVAVFGSTFSASLCVQARLPLSFVRPLHTCSPCVSADKRRCPLLAAPTSHVAPKAQVGPARPQCLKHAKTQPRSGAEQGDLPLQKPRRSLCHAWYDRQAIASVFRSRSQ